MATGKPIGRPPGSPNKKTLELHAAEMDRDEARHFARMIHRGFSATQIEQLLGSDRRKTAAVLAQHQPSGERRGHPTYILKEVAPAIVKPIADANEMAAVLKTMHYSDLPMMLRKEFWAAQKNKQQYELAAGDLWPTAKVIENVGEIYKMVVMAARLTGDAVERQVELSERQRAIIKDQMNGMLRNLEHVIRERFQPPEESGRQYVDELAEVPEVVSEADDDDDL